MVLTADYSLPGAPAKAGGGGVLLDKQPAKQEAQRLVTAAEHPEQILQPVVDLGNYMLNAQ